MYATVTVTVCGTLESETDVSDHLPAFIKEQRELALQSGRHTALYILWHSHRPGIECECIQYEPSLLPAYKWNPPIGDWDD